MAPSPERHAVELPRPSRDADEVGARIDEILARPEFRDDRSLLERALDWVSARIDDLLELVFGGSAGGGVAWLVVAVLVVLAVVFAVRLLRTVAPDPTGAGPTADEVGRPAVDWRDEADRHEADGRWREAVRCRYRAVIADLSAQGLVEEAPGRTAGAYLREARAAAPALAGPLGEATRRFEAVWYGGRDAGPADAERLRALADELARTPSAVVDR